MARTDEMQVKKALIFRLVQVDVDTAVEWAEVNPYFLLLKNTKRLQQRQFVFQILYLLPTGCWKFQTRPLFIPLL